MKRNNASMLAVAMTMAVSATFFAPAKVHRVDVTPGTFESRFDLDSFAPGDTLALAGTLNNTDISHLRLIMGRDTAGNPVPAVVKRLDLHDVTFENSGIGSYFKTEKNHAGGARTLPRSIFYEVPVEYLRYPSGMDSIAPYALWYTALTQINIPEGVRIDNMAIAFDTLVTDLSVPAMADGLSPAYYVLPAVRHVRYGDMDYMRSGAFRQRTPDIEEIVFDGMIGHIDGYQIENCPRLKRVIFNGPILSTGGTVFADSCPELEEIQFNGLVFGHGLVENPNCPKLARITVNGAVYESADTVAVPRTPLADIAASPAMMAQLEQLARWQAGAMYKPGFIGKVARGNRDDMAALLDTLGLGNLTAMLDSAFTATRNPDDDKTKLQILKEAAPYSAYTGTDTLRFTYTEPTDSLLALDREYFNLDSVAGTGDDISRIKNLLYWVHDLVPHDGSSSWPDCHFNLRELAEVCRTQERGLNCRFMAMMLTEALLAEGIPARYVTCLPKAWDEDNDCHVITVAWSESLGKWVWVDPTFAAYVTDENGLMLHPGEVRQRLRDGLPLVLNDDANWNHRASETKEHYLDQYMAKNLYMLNCTLLQQPEPEGNSTRARGRYCTLAPTGFAYPNTHILISDEELFWQPPH